MGIKVVCPSLRSLDRQNKRNTINTTTVVKIDYTVDFKD